MIYTQMLVPLTLDAPTEYEVKNYSKQGEFYPPFYLKLGELQLLAFQIDSRHPGHGKAKSPKNRAIRVNSSIITWVGRFWGISSVFWLLYQFKLSDEQFIEALLFMGWEGPLIGQQQLRAIEILKEEQGLDIPYTLCMPCHATGYFPDNTTYCDSCLGLGSYALYDEPYFQPLRVAESLPTSAASPEMLHPAHALDL